jgi:hypothetical protein
MLRRWLSRSSIWPPLVLPLDALVDPLVVFVLLPVVTSLLPPVESVFPVVDCLPLYTEEQPVPTVQSTPDGTEQSLKQHSKAVQRAEQRVDPSGDAITSSS